jgi:hypothetical protein
MNDNERRTNLSPIWTISFMEDLIAETSLYVTRHMANGKKISKELQIWIKRKIIKSDDYY